MAKLNVGKWQAARRSPFYTPVMQYFWRQIKMAVFEAMRVKNTASLASLHEHHDKMGYLSGDSSRQFALWDAAVMARHWIARPAPDPFFDREGWMLSFDAACLALGCDPDTERLALLEKIDAAADFDTEECWARVEYLSANPPDECEEPLFDAPRVVPALDQGCLFAMEAM